MKNGSVDHNNRGMRKERKLVYRTKNEKKYNVLERTNIVNYTENWVMKKEMKKIVVKEFSDWSIEEMVEYVLTGRKPMKKNV